MLCGHTLSPYWLILHKGPYTSMWLSLMAPHAGKLIPGNGLIRGEPIPEHCSPTNGLQHSDWLFSSSAVPPSHSNAIPPQRNPDKDVKSEKHINKLDLVTHQRVRIDQISFLSVCKLNYRTSAAHYPSFFADCVSRGSRQDLTNAEVTGLREYTLGTL